MASLLVSTGATWGMLAGSLAALLMLIYGASQALTKHEAQESVYGQLQILKSSRTVFSTRLPVQRFPWHGE